MSSSAAFTSLWPIALLNIVVGSIIWFFNRGDAGSSSLNVESFAWVTFGFSLVGFGIGVAVLTLVAHAIVGAIQEKSRGPVPDLLWRPKD